MDAYLAARLEHPLFLVDHPESARAVAEILTRPCFAPLERTSMKQGDRWVQHAKTTSDLVTRYLVDPASEGAALDSGHRGELSASAAVPNGTHARTWHPSPTRLLTYVVLPYVASTAATVVGAVQELARVLDARSGAITLEPSYSLGQRWALSSKPKPRAGLSVRRQRERRGHRIREDRLADQISGLEWGTFLGPGHLASVSPQAVARANPARIVEVTPTLTFVQATDDLTDELTDGFDARLDALRCALTPVLMDLSGLE